ncbi:MAG: SDR family oxidoreductase [Deltaproteobacteria bacterium]|nr:SDR family oxidoreductase [Deltaproteobacteria bacterium]
MYSAEISIKKSFAGRHVFLAGGTGFLGKVWLAMALERLEGIGRIYVLVRPGAQLSSQQRFENLINTSPVFKRLHERFGPQLSRHISQRVEVLEGDLAEPNLGLSQNTANRLQRNLDLAINCAGQVDFNPDIRKALASNVDTTMQLLRFLQRCDRASFLHVSTCYVAGNRQGRIDEVLNSNPLPLQQGFDPELELANARAASREISQSQDSAEVQEKLSAALEKLVERRPNNGNGDRSRFIKSYSRRWLREYLRREMIEEGKRRANRWGWQNTYTYSKGIAEALLSGQARDIRYTIVRPSIIESSFDYPFPGWNQGFNASAPLAYLLGTWFHLLPAKRDVPFDVVPVDMVCRALSVIGAALMLNRHAPVYHIGTSDRNRFTLGRACELTDLGHRRYLREKGKTTLERVLLSRWDAKLVDADHLFSTRNLRRAVVEMSDLIEDFPRLIRKRSVRLTHRLNKAEKQLREIQDLLEVYQPFIHDNFQIFCCRAIDSHPPLEPEFRFAPELIDWRKYWIEVHMPGLRRWVFPQFEGRSRELFHSDHPVSLTNGEELSPAVGNQKQRVLFARAEN